MDKNSLLNENSFVNLNHLRDNSIEFDEKNHIYYVNSKKIDYSVTEFVHLFFPEFNSDNIIEKYYEIWQSNENSPYFGLTPSEIRDLWQESGNEAARLGTILHKDIESFYLGKNIKNNSKEYSHFQEFYNDFSDFKPIKMEWCIYDEELGIAGSIDCIFENDGEIIIVDWKRSKEIKEQSREQGFYPLSHLPNANYWHYSLQLNIYKYILEKNYNLKISGMNLVILHPNNDSYKIIKVQNLQKEVEDIFKLRLKELDI